MGYYFLMCIAGALGLACGWDALLSVKYLRLHKHYHLRFAACVMQLACCLFLLSHWIIAFFIVWGMWE